MLLFAVHAAHGLKQINKVFFSFQHEFQPVLMFSKFNRFFIRSKGPMVQREERSGPETASRIKAKAESRLRVAKNTQQVFPNPSP